MDISKLLKTLTLLEADDSHRPSSRISSDDIEYELTGATQKATREKDYNAIIARLSTQLSGKFTKIAKGYKNIKMLSDQLAKEKKEISIKATSAIESLFPIEDDIYTRVVQTASMVIKLSKVTPASEKEELDVNSYIEELESRLLPALGDGLDELRKKFIKVKQVPARKPSLLAPKFIENKETLIIEDLNIFDKLKNWAEKTKIIFDKFLLNYDKKLNNLEMRINQTFP